MKKLLATAIAMATLACVTVMAAETKTATLDVAKMDCAACPITVSVALKKVPGVEGVKIDFKTKTAVVVFDPEKTTSAALTKATADAGFPSTVKQVQ